MPLSVPADVAGRGDAARKPRQGLEQEHGDDERGAEIGGAGTHTFQSVLGRDLRGVFDGGIQRRVLCWELRDDAGIARDG